MPRTKKQEIIYTIMMVIVMVYGMVCYNIALDTKGMQYFIFGAALSELPLMGVVAFVLDTFIAGPIAKKITFRLLHRDRISRFLLFFLYHCCHSGQCVL